MLKWPALSLIAFVVFFQAVTPRNASAQGDPIFEEGFKPFGSFQQGNIDSVNLLNGYLNLSIPIASYPQRGGKLKVDFLFNYLANIFLTVQTDCGSGFGYCYYYVPSSGAISWRNDFEFNLQRNCVPPDYNPDAVTGPDGSAHLIGPSSSLTSDGTAYDIIQYPNTTPPGCGASPCI